MGVIIMNFNIKSIDKDNYREIIELQVGKAQVSFIETTEQCLKEAKEESLWRPVGLYDGERPVGFAMYGLFKEEGEKGRVWLDRFLISHVNQGKGYGKIGVKSLLIRLYREYGFNEIYLSVYENNEIAIKLYKEIGFLFNDEVDINGEKVMVIDLSKTVLKHG